MAENILLWVAYMSLCVILAVMALAVVGLFICLGVKAYKQLKNDDFCSYGERREGE